MGPSILGAEKGPQGHPGRGCSLCPRHPSDTLSHQTVPGPQRGPPTLQMKRLRFREVKVLAQCHRATRWQGQTLTLPAQVSCPYSVQLTWGKKTSFLVLCQLLGVLFQVLMALAPPPALPSLSPLCKSTWLLFLPSQHQGSQCPHLGNVPTQI